MVSRFATAKCGVRRRQSLIRGRVCLCLLVLSAFTASAAQTVPKNEFGFRAAASVANGHAFGFTQNTSLYIAEARYSRLFFSGRHVVLRFAPKFSPVVLIGEPETLTGARSRHYVYGAGASPFGIQMNLLPARHVQPYWGATGGFVYFTEHAFSPQASHFNFTAEIEGGAQIFVSPKNAVLIGYRYHHISNANFYRSNPALDAHMIVLGFSFLF